MKNKLFFVIIFLNIIFIFIFIYLMNSNNFYLEETNDTKDVFILFYVIDKIISNLMLDKIFIILSIFLLFICSFFLKNKLIYLIYLFFNSFLNLVSIIHIYYEFYYSNLDVRKDLFEHAIWYSSVECIIFSIIIIIFSFYLVGKKDKNELGKLSDD